MADVCRIQWHIIPEPPATLQGAATGRIQRQVMPEPRITLQGAATWWIHCHISRAAILKIVFRLIFWFLMQFGLWRAAAFVSSPIQLFLWLPAPRINQSQLAVSRSETKSTHVRTYQNVAIIIEYSSSRKQRVTIMPRFRADMTVTWLWSMQSFLFISTISIVIIITYQHY